MKRDQLIAVIALMVAGVWSIVALTSLLMKDYRGLTIITPIMGIVTGFLFALRRNGNGEAPSA